MESQSDRSVFDVLVTKKTKEADDTFSYELRDPRGGELPPFTPGAHIDIHLPNKLTRQYSLSNKFWQRDHYRIAVLRDPATRGGSKTLHDEVESGHTVSISFPRNLFELAPTKGRSILFAGGIGITPIICMAAALASRDAEFSLHYCARSRSRAAFYDEILEDRIGRVTRFYFDDEGPVLSVAEVLRNSTPADHLYVCGPTGFIKHVVESARGLGWAEDAIHREYFAAVAAPKTSESEFEVLIKSTGETVTVGAEETVVAALSRLGIEVPVSCEQGICGTCVTGIVEGTPEHRDMFLTARERGTNRIFTPCCSRSKSATLVLDL
jgi:vanillate O-demethylase ferredoxin subunit